MKRVEKLLSGILVLSLLIVIASSVKAQDDVASWDKAVSLYKQNQFREAITEFKRFLVEYPSHAESWKFLGLSYFQLKEYEPAIEALVKSSDLKRAEGRTDFDILAAISRSQLGLNHYDQALPYLETLTKQQPEVGGNFYLLGFAYANLKRNNDAINALKTSVKLDSKDLDAWYYLGLIQLRSGNLDQAISALRGGVAVDPSNIEILNLLAETLIRRGLSEPEAPKANAIFDEAVKTATKLQALRNDAASTELLGRIYLAAKKFTSAELTLSRALAMTKEPTATLYFNLGLAHAQNKSWAKASEMLLQANRLNPGNVDTLNYLGFVYENLRKYSQALDAYNRAYEASGRNSAEIKEAINRVTPMVKPQ